MTFRATPVCDRIISPNQTTFLKGRYILESVVTAHEILHSVATGGAPGLILKLDYEKAYDRVSWQFLTDMLRSRGFGEIWIRWILSVTKGTFCVRINNTNGPYYPTGRGLKQGDSLSPVLFNLVVDVFTKMLMKVTARSLIIGLIPEIISGGIISLQYADNTILFLDHSISTARNTKWLLTYFEQISGMKINFIKVTC